MPITNGANGDSTTAVMPRVDGNAIRSVGVAAALTEAVPHSARRTTSGADRLCSLARALWKSRTLIACTTAALVAVAIGVSYSIPPKY
jgi:hypothetical protein